MERKAFQLLHNSELSWWYHARARAVERILLNYCIKTDLPILDLGAGFGGMAEVLRRYGSVDAFEPDQEARVVAQKRGYTHVLESDDYTLLPNNHYTMIALFDVLEHVPDDQVLLSKLHDVLTPTGSIIITVPAFQLLWSNHDVQHHHYRRYTMHQLKKLLSKQGFEVRYISYWNMFLFLPALLVRMLGHSGESSFDPDSFLNRIFKSITSTESLLIPYLQLPFGTGLICYATKKSNNT